MALIRRRNSYSYSCSYCYFDYVYSLLRQLSFAVVLSLAVIGGGGVISWIDETYCNSSSLVVAATSSVSVTTRTTTVSSSSSSLSLSLSLSLNNNNKRNNYYLRRHLQLQEKVADENLLLRKQPQREPRRKPPVDREPQEQEPPQPILEREKRITNGDRVNELRYPYFALMYESSLCGAVAIGPRLVLGVAHCAKSSTDFRIGAYDSVTGGFTSAKIINKIMHPDFTEGGYSNDIMLFHLDSDIADLSSYIKLDRDEVTDNDQNNNRFTVLGFGDIDPDPGSMTLSKGLQEVELEYMDNETCDKAFGNRYAITPGMLCAGGGDEGQDACVGDSGGPLIRKGNTISEDTLVGLVAWGVGCARDGIPGVYTRVSYYYDWIVETICANFPFQAPDYLQCTSSGTVTQNEIDFFLSLQTLPPITKEPTYPPSPKPSPRPTITPTTVPPPTAPTDIPVVAVTIEPSRFTSSGTVNQNEIDSLLSDFFLSLRTLPPITQEPTYPPSPQSSPRSTTTPTTVPPTTAPTDIPVVASTIEPSSFTIVWPDTTTVPSSKESTKSPTDSPVVVSTIEPSRFTFYVGYSF